MKTEEQHNDGVAPKVISKYLEEKYERRAVRNFLERVPMFDNLLEHCGVSRVAIFESKEIENSFLVFLYISLLEVVFLLQDHLLNQHLECSVF